MEQDAQRRIGARARASFHRRPLVLTKLFTPNIRRSLSFVLCDVPLVHDRCQSVGLFDLQPRCTLLHTQTVKSISPMLELSGATLCPWGPAAKTAVPLKHHLMSIGLGVRCAVCGVPYLTSS